MALNLRARLALIREKPGIPASAPEPAGKERRPPDALRESAKDRPPRPPAFSQWEDAGYLTLRRTFTVPAPAIPKAMPGGLPVLLPDLEAAGGASALSPAGFLFFDLETTGLSGGAGTVAFLAAFGRCAGGRGRGRRAGLEITQFLLLDYPGENDFLDAVLRFMGASVNGTFLVTYNGKSFDSQILKTRCLMNGFPPPEFLQLDLLYPARRMWKRVLPNCSQATIETMILGLDRSGDLPGSLAPGIWFDFLRSGETFERPGEAAGRLLGICDHNVKDISGLFSLFAAFTEIAASPAEGAARYRCDLENLAMIWRRSFRAVSASVGPLFRDGGSDAKRKAAALELLEAAAREYPRSCLRLAFDLMRSGRREEGRVLLERLAGGEQAGFWRCPPGRSVPALALRTLAIDAERILRRPDMARAFLERSLLPDADGLPAGLREDLQRRLDRLAPQGVAGGVS